MHDEEKTDLMEYLPEYLKKYHEIKEIMQAENTELENMKMQYAKAIDDSFVISCGAYGLLRFEKMLGITPVADDTLESRKFRIIAKQNISAPYNYAYLARQLEMLCGKDNYCMEMDFLNLTLNIKIGLVSKNMLDSVKEVIFAVVPCNILTIVEQLYNQHKLLGNYTHRQLASYTHRQLREDVIL